MATAGPNYPAAGASLANVGTLENRTAWVNPGNVGSSAAVTQITSANFDQGYISQILVASDFGFNVTGTIDGITVEISKRGFTSANSGTDFRVQLATGTTFADLVGDNKATADVWPQTTLATTTYGGTTDTWNAGLTDTQVNSANFAVFVSANANVANADIEVDWVRVTLTYTSVTTVPGSFTASAVIRKVVAPTGPSTDAIIKRTIAPTGFTVSAASARVVQQSFGISAIVRSTIAPTATADGVVKRTITPSGFGVSAIAAVTKTGNVTGSAVVQKTTAPTFTGSAILQATLPGSITADAVTSASVQGSFGISAIVFATISPTFTADANVASAITTVEGSFGASAVLVAVPATWTTPVSETPVNVTPTFAFNTPVLGRDQHFNMQLDKVDTFNGADFRDIKSNFDQAGWEYWDGGQWTAVPATGMPQAYEGNEARHTIQVTLSAGIWYRRVRAG